MNVEQLRKELEKYPGEYEVKDLHRLNPVHCLSATSVDKVVLIHFDNMER